MAAYGVDRRLLPATAAAVACMLVTGCGSRTVAGVCDGVRVTGAEPTNFTYLYSDGDKLGARFVSPVPRQVCAWQGAPELVETNAHSVTWRYANRLTVTFANGHVIREQHVPRRRLNPWHRIAYQVPVGG